MSRYRKRKRIKYGYSQSLFNAVIKILITSCIALLILPVTYWIKDIQIRKQHDFSPSGIYVSRRVLYKLDDMRKYSTKYLHNVNISFYNNERAQTDSTPNITSSNRLVYEGSIAVSRDILKIASFGDLVYVKETGKFYIIEDIMNPRYSNSMDIFLFDKQIAKKLGRFKSDVLLYTIHK